MALILAVCAINRGGIAIAEEEVEPEASRATGYPKVANSSDHPPEEVDPEHGVQQSAATRTVGGNRIHEDSTAHEMSICTIRYKATAASYLGEGKLIILGTNNEGSGQDSVYCSDLPIFTVEAPDHWIEIWVDNTISAYAWGVVPAKAGWETHLYAWSRDIDGEVHQNDVHIVSNSTNSRTVAEAQEETRRRTTNTGGEGGTGGFSVHRSKENEKVKTRRKESSEGTTSSSASTQSELYKALVPGYEDGWDSVTWSELIASGGTIEMKGVGPDTRGTLESTINVRVTNIVGAWAYTWSELEPPNDPNPPPVPNDPKTGAPKRPPKIAMAGAITLPDTGGICAAATIAEPSLGLKGETGAKPGLIAVVLEDALPMDIAFSVAADPSGLVSFPNGTTLVIAEGDSIGTLAYEVEDDGSLEFTLTLLDEESEPTSTTLSVETETQSISSVSTTQVTVEAFGDRDGGAIVGLAGEEACTLTFCRSAFSGLSSSGTTLNLYVSDPSSAIVSPPSTVTIPAGFTFARLPVVFASNAGTATIEVRLGTTVLKTITLINRTTSFVAIGGMRLPLNALRGFAQFEVTTASQSERLFGVQSLSSGTVSVVGGASVTLPTHRRIGRAQIAPVATGTGTIRFQAPSSGPTTDVSVTVVASEVTASLSSLVLNNLSATGSGNFTFELPAGCTFDDVTVPVGWTNVSVSGVGTSLLTVDIGPRTGMPSSLTLDLELGGASTPEELMVLDRYHAATWMTGYWIEID